MERYVQARTKQDKSIVISSVAEMLREDVGARFLKRATDGTLRVMGEKESRDKVGHALRDLNSMLMSNNSSKSKSKSTLSSETALHKQESKSTAEDDNRLPTIPDIPFSWSSD